MMGTELEKRDGTAVEYPRLIGRFQGSADGKKMIVVGGMHGNEPSGILAARRVLDALARQQPRFRGTLAAYTGNREALERGQRFIDKDFNRIWTTGHIELNRQSGAAESTEDRQQRELLDELEVEIGSNPHDVVFIDLHTSSAAGPPFVTIGDTLRNRYFARVFPLTAILGLEEQIDGALLEYMNNLGCTTIGIEAGQHDQPISIDIHEAALWVALLAAGMLERGDAAQIERSLRYLEQQRAQLPELVEVLHRHSIDPEDGFQMEPGFSNFQLVEAGQRLASDRRGRIEAPFRGLLLLPLYQGQGSDGFFIGRRVHRFWLEVSERVRRLELGDYADWLPGVRQHPTIAETLVIDTRVARFYPLQFFHLLGFRKRRAHGSVLLVGRRAHDRLR
ncbi:MAG: succinylglutamate desuccinylase/aspartoacylase family protein [Acidobacteriota bacterium]|nr:MAG: succinylglutamate desuccinylase/aspartoacylase family protein [Acidobacteriota bacterium]